MPRERDFLFPVKCQEGSNWIKRELFQVELQRAAVYWWGWMLKDYLICFVVFLSDDLPELDDEVNQIAIKYKGIAGPLWL